MKVKNMGQVFTPKHIVEDILKISEYKGENILEKHVVDNSCGNGAFLVEFANRYINTYKNKNHSLEGVEKHLEKYIHGIELDKDVYIWCLEELEKVEKKFKLKKVNWDIVNEDTLQVSKYDGKMDFVIGNPPYVRVHNLEEQYANVKKGEFCNNGMTDLYLIFYELGLRMLNKNGVLTYITPNSFYNSVAGQDLRKYIQTNRNMESITDLGHYQPFEVTTYTTIAKIYKNKQFEKCKYYKYDIETGKPKYISNIHYNDLFVNGNIILSKDNKKFLKILNCDVPKNAKIQVKNAYATLSDDVFIQKEFKFENNVIDILKASTGEWKKCIYPYDKNGKVLPFNKLDEKVQKHLNSNKEILTKRSLEDKSQWYEFGRTQAISDTYKRKVAINTTIKDINSIKLNVVEAGQGVYSGLYILTDYTIQELREKLCTEDFIDYLRVVNKCKSGGYYTFSSKDLLKYLYYNLVEARMDNSDFIIKLKESFEKYLKTNSRTNEKLKILHGAIAEDIAARLGSGFELYSLGYRNGKELTVEGAYYDKNVDIAIKKDGRVVGAIALKYVMSNYSQNSNNYFENMAGETANIRMAGIPYYHVVILPANLPYYTKAGVITKTEVMTEKRMKKYINLSKDDPTKIMHTPDKTLLYLVEFPDTKGVKNKEEYKKYFWKNEYALKPKESNYDFGDGIVYNDYNKFIEQLCNSLKF